MSDTSETEQNPTGPIDNLENRTSEPGDLRMEEKTEDTATPVTLATPVVATPVTSSQSSKTGQERSGTVEHLAVRRSLPPLDTSTPVHKQFLSNLRADWTRVVTGLRWEGSSVKETADKMVPLLNVGPVEQWKNEIIPFLYEIDRGGALIPAWLEIIDRGDPTDLSPDANPAETVVGRARRFALLMLGNYKMMGIASSGDRLRRAQGDTRERDLTEFLGEYALDPSSSLYATAALVKHGTVLALQALIKALHSAQGWAKVDVVEGCLALKQEQFYDLLLASGLDNAAGLESYIAIPLYRSIPLERYLGGAEQANTRLLQQAALIFAQVLQDAQARTTTSTDGQLPVVFERPLSTFTTALLNGAKRYRYWQSALALHRLGGFIGRNWADISQGKIRDARIIEPIYQVAPMMPDIEYWMQSQGRDILLAGLSDAQDQELQPLLKVVSDLHDSRAVSPLIARLNTVQSITDRQHGLLLGSLCDTLGVLGDAHAVPALLTFLTRIIPIGAREAQPLRKDNLPAGDPHIPGSIVYAAIVRACGRLGDRSALRTIWQASHDFDPYVRSQALEALKRLDPQGAEQQSRATVREALRDPRESVVRVASQMTVGYRDEGAIPVLNELVAARPELAHILQDALRQLTYQAQQA